MYNKIEEILIKKGLNITEFIDETKISRTTVYALKNGKTDRLNNKSLRKICEVFPEYTVEWFYEKEQKKNINTIGLVNEYQASTPKEDLFLEYKGVKVPLDVVVNFAIQNHDAMMNNEGYLKIINGYGKQMIIEHMTKLLMEKRRK